MFPIQHLGTLMIWDVSILSSVLIAAEKSYQYGLFNTIIFQSKLKNEYTISEKQFWRVICDLDLPIFFFFFLDIYSNSSENNIRETQSIIQGFYNYLISSNPNCCGIKHLWRLSQCCPLCWLRGWFCRTGWM